MSTQCDSEEPISSNEPIQELGAEDMTPAISKALHSLEEDGASSSDSEEFDPATGLSDNDMKKMVSMELDNFKKQLFEQMVDCADEESDEDMQINSMAKEEHNVSCNGCGVARITGVRYKCTVCKKFDFCSKCEERRGHDHPFLKINLKEQVPKAMLTVIDDSMPNAEADIEQDLRTEGPNSGNMMLLNALFGNVPLPQA